MTAAALTAGKRLRAAAIRALEARTSPPYALLLEPVTNGEVQPTALAGELAREYPGTALVPASSRKMGADGRVWMEQLWSWEGIGARFEEIISD